MRDSANQPYFPANLANNGSGDFVLPVDLSYEIDLWGRVRRGVTSAREQAQASDADLETARLSLHAELAMDYFGLRASDAQTKLLDDTVNAYRAALQLTQDRFDGGAAPQSDVAQARTQLEQAIVQRTDLKVQRAQYEHAIAVLIGKLAGRVDLAASAAEPEVPNAAADTWSLCRQSCCNAALTLRRRNAEWLQRMNRSVS